MTRHAPALLSFGGRLQLAYTGTTAHAYVLSSTNGVDWSAQTQLHGGAISGPTLGVRDNALHCAYAALGAGIWVNWSKNATSWTNSGQIPHARSVLTPAMVTRRGMIQMAYRDADNGNVAFMTAGDSGWSTPTHGPDTLDSPALAVRGDTLYCAIRRDDDKIWISESSGGWSRHFVPVPGVTSTYSAPALAAVDTNDRTSSTEPDPTSRPGCVVRASGRSPPEVPAAPNTKSGPLSTGPPPGIFIHTVINAP
ncbi:hypothetical protein [Embleya sp. AB8]|uniref:hypothetical protein n=1 Tax=Embleya sp. AB8 TaxID=3156304 RepID=UPI003C71B675